ncbi:unnamed protein product [Mesocestoides corti]|uniref:Uncharacterized protein n=1 Tax=Mesocestoides corti TaxID=53468 RepID=A0A0R3UJV4_MESCO|nr:unnamed protein product [Mesocestoides corti]
MDAELSSGNRFVKAYSTCVLVMPIVLSTETNHSNVSIVGLKGVLKRECAKKVCVSWCLVSFNTFRLHCKVPLWERLYFVFTYYGRVYMAH